MARLKSGWIVKSRSVRRRRNSRQGSLQCRIADCTNVAQLCKVSWMECIVEDQRKRISFIKVSQSMLCLQYYTCMQSMYCPAAVVVLQYCAAWEEKQVRPNRVKSCEGERELGCTLWKDHHHCYSCESGQTHSYINCLVFRLRKRMLTGGQNIWTDMYSGIGLWKII